MSISAVSLSFPTETVASFILFTVLVPETLLDIMTISSGVSISIALSFSRTASLSTVKISSTRPSFSGSRRRSFPNLPPSPIPIEPTIIDFPAPVSPERILSPSPSSISSSSIRARFLMCKFCSIYIPFSFFSNAMTTRL